MSKPDENDGDDVDGLLASLTDDYREPQATIPADVEDFIEPSEPPPPAPRTVQPKEPPKPAAAPTLSKVPRPPMSRIPRPGADSTAKPPSVNPAGPPRREPFPPATSPAPRTMRPLPRPSQRRFGAPTDFDESEIDAVLGPLSEPPGTKTTPPQPDSTAKTVPPPPGLELPALDRAAESWNPPDIGAESLEELDAVELGESSSDARAAVVEPERASGGFESDGPTRTYVDEPGDAPSVSATASSFDEWDDEAVTSLRMPADDPPSRPLNDAPTLDPDADASLDYTSASFEELGVVTDPEATAGLDLESRSSSPPDAPRDFSSQRSAAAHLGDNRMTAAWVARAEWFEAEAASTADAGARGRLLLAASELWAMAGSTAKARDAARRAAQANPGLSLANRQARWLSALDGDWKAVATALDVESRAAATDPGRAHAAYLSSEVHRLHLQDATAAERRLDLLARAAPEDPRPYVAKLVAELGTQAAAPKARAPEVPALNSLAGAVSEIARLRGAPRTEETPPPEVAFQDARRAVIARDRLAAGKSILSLRTLGGVGDGALFLAAALFTPDPATRNEAIAALRELFARAPGRDVKRALAARALEQGDAPAMTQALAETADENPAFDGRDRVALSALSGGSLETLREGARELLEEEALRPLAAAATSAASAAEAVPLGDPKTRARLGLGRRLASAGSPEELKDAVHAVRAAEPDAPIGRVLSLELDAAAGATSAVAAELGRLAPSGHEADGKLASALIEEAAGHADVARRHYTSVLATPSVAEAAARALVQNGANGTDLLSMLASTLGEAPSTRQALLLVEAAVRGGLEDKDAAEDLLGRAHDAAPHIALAARLGEDLARSRGDVPGLTSWLRRRRDGATDPIARALHLVREAFLIADEDASAAAARVVEAVAARPEDVALHELLERLDPTPSVERGKWRERVADTVADARTKSWLYFEAAIEYERDGALDEARNAAQAGASIGGSELGKVFADRLGGEPAAKAPAELFSQRAREQRLLGTDRDEELLDVASALIDLPDPAEAAAHARLAVRLRAKQGSWESGRDLVERAARQFPRSLWTLRQLSAQARAAGDFMRMLEADQELAARTERPIDAGTLSLRAAEAAARLGRARDALGLLERTIGAVPDHLVARDLRAQIEEELGEFAAAAEDLEGLGRACVGREYQWDAWYRAGILWADRAGNSDRALSAFEQAAAVDVTRRDLFDRLQLLYVEKGDREKLAALLERRLAGTTDPAERIALEVIRGRALADVGDRAAARQALGAALDADPDHADALEVYASLSAADGDYTSAEESWIRLARIFTEPEKQALIYGKLAELYETNLPNAERAEICYREILKRKPDDVAATQGLVRAYARSGDPAKAVKLQTELVDRAGTSDEKRDHTIALALLYDESLKDKKAALGALEKARKTWPHDSALLKATAELHQRHGETAALNVLVDRASSEARRALGHGRFDPAFFGVLRAAAEVRGQKDAARLATAALAALENRDVEPVGGAGAAAGQPELDDLLAPELLSPALRAFLRKLPGVLDAAYPLDAKALRAGPVPPGAVDLVEEMRVVAESVGIRSLEILVSPALGPVFVPASSTPARIVMGQALLDSEEHGLRYFCLFRALKMIQTHSAALTRISPIELWPALAALLTTLSPTFQPQAVDAAKLADAKKRLKPNVPAHIDEELATLALEVGGTIGNRASQLGQAVGQWGSRTALLAVGDPALALNSVAAALGQTEGVPKDVAERLKWVQRHPEARDVIVFAVSEAYSELRRKVGLAD